MRKAHEAVSRLPPSSERSRLLFKIRDAEGAVLGGVRISTERHSTSRIQGTWL
jgi:hypothetical protein